MILALGVAVRLAAFVIPAGRHRRWRFAETHRHPLAGNPSRGWRRDKMCRAEAFVSDTPAIRAARITVATAAVMRNVRILLSARRKSRRLVVIVLGERCGTK